jgi:serine/threonine-protein kinase
VRYAPTGHLVYGTEAGALVALPFNARTQAVTGSPVSLLEGLLVKPAVGTADFTFSATGRMVYVAGREEARRLIIVDATGGEHQVGAGTSLTSPRFSPDGKRIAYSSVENRSTDIRVLDIARQTLTRLTFSGLNSYPEWTHDGRRVAFYSNNLGSGTSTGVTGNDLYWALSDGSGHPQPLLVAPGSQMELQFAPGDRTFAYRQTVGSTGRDIWIAAVDSPQNPHAWLATEFEERAMALSPDGHWMAYVSNASGRDEVYVREFPVPSGQWQISADGGIEPRWAHSGRAIFFRGGDSLVSVAVTTRPAFVVGARSLVFARPYFMGDTHHTHWDVAPDDRHFAFVSAPTGSPGLVVTLNWFDELRRRTTSGTGTGTAPGRP